MIIRATRRLLASGALAAILSLSAGCGLQATRSSGLDGEWDGWGSDSPVTLADGTVVSDSGARPIGAGHSRTYRGRGGDIWDRIRAGFQLQVPDNPAVQGEVDWFGRNQGFLDRTAQRAHPYLYHIVEQVEARGVPLEIALLPVVESAFQPFAYSPARAAGIWQFIPDTGRRFGLRQTWWYDGRRDVIESTQAALDYLTTLNQQFSGDWLLAVAAYNCGEGNVARAIQENERQGRPTDFWNLSLPEETRGYVPRLLALARVVSDPGAYGVRLAHIPNEPYITRVAMEGPIDLQVAAEAAGMPLADVRHLNAGHSRWATDPEGPHHLVLPIDKTRTFLAQLETMPQHERTPWKRHVIQRGETLNVVASRYNTSPEMLQQVNDLPTGRVRPGHVIRVPLSPRASGTSVVLADATQEPTSAAATRSSARGGSESTRTVSYSVRKGETLHAVARKHSVSVADLARWNGLSTQAHVKAGQTLKVRGPAPAALVASAGHTGTAPRPGKAGTSSRNTPGAKPAPEPQVIRYRVKSGETLWAISQRFGVTVAMLRRWNNLDGKQSLQAGQQIDVHVAGTRIARTG
jgi:membrane-bound lytic murein transglycosylase D